jgi:hypothetical protein
MNMPTPSLDKTNLVLGASALLLSLGLITLSFTNRSLQRQLQAQQVQINNGRVTQQVATNVIRELAQVGVSNKDQDLLNLLKKHGFDVKVGANSPSSTHSTTPR